MSVSTTIHGTHVTITSGMDRRALITAIDDATLKIERDVMANNVTVLWDQTEFAFQAEERTDVRNIVDVEPVAMVTYPAMLHVFVPVVTTSEGGVTLDK